MLSPRTPTEHAIAEAEAQISVLQCYIEILRPNVDTHPCSLDALEIESDIQALLNKYIHLAAQKSKLDDDTELRTIRWEKLMDAQERSYDQSGKLHTIMSDLYKEYRTEDKDGRRATLHKKLKHIIKQRTVLQKERDASPSSGVPMMTFPKAASKWKCRNTSDASRIRRKNQ